MGHDRPEDTGPLPLLMVASKRTGGEGTGTSHSQLDMCGLLPVICSLAGVASIYLFPN